MVNNFFNHSRAGHFSLLWKCAALVGLCLVILSRPASIGAQVPNTDSEAVNIVAAINQWRIDQGLWPLKQNSILTQMAVDHANFLLSLPTMPEGGNLHFGRKGETPRQRAVAAPYNWPSYSNKDQAAIGENAGIGDLKLAMNYWAHSDTHRKTALNVEYREIGVAALPYKKHYLYIVVFGSRPNVLPTLIDPATGKLYLTSERYKWAKAKEFIHDAVKFRVFDDGGNSITDNWIPWQPTIALPQAVNKNLSVVYSDGKKEVRTDINLRADVAILPGYTAPEVVVAPTSTPQTVALVLATNTPQGSAIVAASNNSTGSKLPALVFATNTPFASAANSVPTTVPVQPTRVSPTSVPTNTPLPQAKLAIVYDKSALFVVNVSSRTLDVASLELFNTVRTLRFNAWAQFSSAALTSRPPGACLQVYGWKERNIPNPPAECKQVVSIVNIASDRLFWTAGDFALRRSGDNPLVTCPASAGRCEVVLSQT
jgi:uncharacterized protein YkwD